MISITHSLRLNQYAQGILPMAEARNWFSTFDDTIKMEILRALVSMVYQAHPRPDDLPTAVIRAGLKLTHTPCTLIRQGPFAVQAAKVLALPRSEREKSFLLFIALLGIADTRRREFECKDGCSH